MTGAAVISGTTHGIGRVTARELARAGHPLVMLCRDVPAAERVRDEIIAAAPRASVQVVRCDLASLASVREAAAAVRRAAGELALLINNAGIVTTRRELSAEGFELTFATNHLGPFLLTELLREQMAPGGRIINLASRAHYRVTTMSLDEVADPRPRYTPGAAYGRSKLANVLYTFALARRVDAAHVAVNCLHPGVVATNLLPRWLRIVKPLISRPIFDAERGARTTLYLALADRARALHGCYVDEHQEVQAASPLANDVALQEALWAASARWAGLSR